MSQALETLDLAYFYVESSYAYFFCKHGKNKMELMSNSEAYLDRIAILRKKIKSKISRDGDFPNSDVLLDKIDAIEKEFIKDIEKSKIEGRGE